MLFLMCTCSALDEMNFSDSFQDAFVKSYSQHFGNVTQAKLSASYLRHFADSRLINDCNRIKLKWRIVMPITDVFKYGSYYYPQYRPDETYMAFISELRIAVFRFLRIQRILRRMIVMATEWYQNKVLRCGVVVARNRKDLLPDRKFEIRYHPREGYFATAFSGRFGADIENGEYVIKVNAAGTSQDAIGLYSVVTLNRIEGRAMMYAHLDNALLHGLDSFRQTYGCVIRLGELFMDTHFMGVCAGYVNDYIEETILNQKGFSSIQRLERFISVKPVLAEHIWTENLSTPQERASIAVQLKISKRNIGGFTNAATTVDLQKFIVRKWDSKRSMLDDLPKHLWTRIQNAETAYESAKRGVPVGLRGWYISSESIDIARNRLRDAWRDADIWIGQHVVKSK